MQAVVLVELAIIVARAVFDQDQAVPGVVGVGPVLTWENRPVLIRAASLPIRWHLDNNSQSIDAVGNWSDVGRRSLGGVRHAAAEHMEGSP